jgi:hypothetical protein
MHFEAPSPPDGDQRGDFKSPVNANLRETAFIPLYGFGLKTAAGVADTIITRVDSPLNRTGRGIEQNLSPENFVAFNHYNFLQSDIDQLEAGKSGGGLDQIKSSGWHNQRVLAGRLQESPDKAGVGLTP